MNIRPTKLEDVASLQTVLDETGLFPSDLLPDMIGSFFSNKEPLEIWLTCEANGRAVGFCYAAPEALADGTWNMLAIAVHPSQQGGGHGGALVKHLEDALRRKGHRVLIADTSGTEEFAQTRKFYQKCGYSEEARIRDSWAAGDDKIVFWKSLL